MIAVRGLIQLAIIYFPQSVHHADIGIAALGLIVPASHVFVLGKAETQGQ